MSDGNPLEGAEYADVHEEATRWVRGDMEADHYAQYLDQSADNPLSVHGDGPLNKVLKPEDMPWELSQQGLLKHMLNERIADEYDYPAKGLDLYMQLIPPDSQSGRHRHRSEEILIVLEGSGYDLHWDADIEVDEDRGVVDWVFEDEPKRFDWEAGDAVYVPVNTIHQHYNDGDEPARFISAQARTYTNLGYGYADLKQYETAPEYGGQTDD